MVQCSYGKNVFNFESFRMRTDDNLMLWISAKKHNFFNLKLSLIETKKKH